MMPKTNDNKTTNHHTSHHQGNLGESFLLELTTDLLKWFNE
jgi:hypothetical protein